MSWNRVTCGIVIASLVVVSPALGQLPKANPQSFRHIELFEEVWQLCTNYIYSPTQAPPDWKALWAKYRPMIEKTGSLDESSTAINMMLDELKTSHTHLYTSADWEYYDLFVLSTSETNRPLK